MNEFALATTALMLCLLLLWLRVHACGRSVQFHAFRGVVSAPGGVGVITLDPLSGWPMARVARFSLHGAGFNLGELMAHDPALAIAAGNTVTAVYAERAGVAARPALLFNHESSRWRVVPGTWVPLRGDAPSHYLPVLVFFGVVYALWTGAAAAATGIAADAALPGFDSVLVAVAALATTLGSLAVLTTLALRTLDETLERRAVAALSASLYALPEDDRARRAVLNLAAPRTRRAPASPDLISL